MLDTASISPCLEPKKRKSVGIFTPTASHTARRENSSPGGGGDEVAAAAIGYLCIACRRSWSSAT